MDTKEFHGVIPPVVIPLDEKKQLDLESFERSINRMIDAGVNGLFFLGSSGEVAFLTDAQRYHVLQESVAIVNHRVPVLAGVIDMETLRVIDSASARRATVSTRSSQPHRFTHSAARARSSAISATSARTPTCPCSPTTCPCACTPSSIPRCSCASAKTACSRA